MRHTILRHPDENLAKCSLEPLRAREDLRFIEANPGVSVDGTGFVLLEVGAPLISPEDAGRPLLLLDANWKHLPKLRMKVKGMPLIRSLPAIPTAYPRRNFDSQDPAEGLASVEALYLALRLIGAEDRTLLEHYYWRQRFLNNVDTALAKQR